MILPRKTCTYGEHTPGTTPKNEDEMFQNQGWPEEWLDGYRQFNRDDSTACFINRDGQLKANGMSYNSFVGADKSGELTLCAQV